MVHVHPFNSTFGTIVTSIRFTLKWSAGNAKKPVQKLYPQLKTDKYPDLPDNFTFLKAEGILDKQ